jgi:hypothetical protein
MLRENMSALSASLRLQAVEAPISGSIPFGCRYGPICLGRCTARLDGLNVMEIPHAS